VHWPAKGHDGRVDQTAFTDDENWYGGYYELAIDLGLRNDPGSDVRLSRALRTLWSDPHLDGCYLDRWRATTVQERVPAALPDPNEPAPLYGIAVLPSGGASVCVTHVIREVGGETEPHDWLDLSLPTGALERLDNRVEGFPFADEDDSLVWRRPIDDWLASVATVVFAEAGFRVALIGFEVSGSPAAETISDVPDERWIGYLVNQGGYPTYFPATR